MWIIDKTFDFCFGHRVHAQSLDPILSCNSVCKCRHLHGHQGQIKVFLKSVKLDEKGMVLDFVELNWFKKWIDDTLDHKMILDVYDPALPMLFPLLTGQGLANSGNRIFQLHPEGYYTINPVYYQDLPAHEQEIYEGLILVSFIPTSEHLSRWLYSIVSDKLHGIAVVDRVEFNETPKSRSTFYANS